MKTILFVWTLLVLSVVDSMAQAPIFEQNFSTSTNVDDYAHVSPGPAQFNLINTMVADASVALVNGTGLSAVNGTALKQILDGKLNFKLKSGYRYYSYETTSFGFLVTRYGYQYVPTSGSFVKEIPATHCLKLQFRLKISGTQENLEPLNAGGGFILVNGATLLNSADIYFKRAQDFSVMSNNGYSITSFSGERLITMIINKGSDPFLYEGPTPPSGRVAAAMETAAAQTLTMWVDGQKYIELFTNSPTNVAITSVGYQASSNRGSVSGFSTMPSAPVAPEFTVNFDDVLIEDLTPPGNPLPVRLLHFNAEATESRQVRLAWETGEERNSSHFVVERSRNMREFEILGQVESTGSSLISKKYDFIDQSPLPGANYYRLRQVDRDGSETVYRSQSVTISSYGSLYPNPSDGRYFTVEADLGSVVTIRSITGGDIPFRSRILNATKLEISPTSALQPGLYIVSVNGRGKRWIVR